MKTNRRTGVICGVFSVAIALIGCNNKSASTVPESSTVAESQTDLDAIVAQKVQEQFEIDRRVKESVAAATQEIAIPAMARDTLNMSNPSEQDKKDITDIFNSDNSGIYYVPVESWYGTYEAAMNGHNYVVTISPLWEDAPRLNVIVTRFTGDNPYADSLWQYTFDTRILKGEAVYDGNGWIAFFQRMNDSNPGVSDVDFSMLMSRDNSGNFNEMYLGVSISPNAKLANGVIKMEDNLTYDASLTGVDAFPVYRKSEIESSAILRKSQDAYPVAFADWSNTPDWYQKWSKAEMRPYVNWDIQSNTPKGNPPLFIINGADLNSTQ